MMGRRSLEQQNIGSGGHHHHQMPLPVSGGRKMSLIVMQQQQRKKSLCIPRPAVGPEYTTSSEPEKIAKNILAWKL